MVLFGEILNLSSEYGTIVFITVLFFILLFEGGAPKNIYIIIYDCLLSNNITFTFFSSVLGAIESSCESRGLQVLHIFIHTNMHEPPKAPSLFTFFRFL